MPSWKGKHKETKSYTIMGRRFEELNEVYNTLTAINFDFSTLPATNKYRSYSEWVRDPELRKLPASSRTDSGRKSQVGLLAFGYPSLNNDDHVLVKVGQRAFEHIGTISSNALFNLTLTSIPDTYSPMPGFVPAKVVLGLRGAATTPRSQITGQEYKKTIQRTYTIPIGKGTGAGQETEFDVQDAILADPTISELYSITFKPEKLSRR
ncbi:MAG: hypothetical protein WBM32_03620 [Crocosphaera sp.]